MSCSLIHDAGKQKYIHFSNTSTGKWNETFFRNIFLSRLIIKLRICSSDHSAIRENCTLKDNCEVQHEKYSRTQVQHEGTPEHKDILKCKQILEWWVPKCAKIFLVSSQISTIWCKGFSQSRLEEMILLLLLFKECELQDY